MLGEVFKSYNYYVMPRHVIEGFPTINWLGFYPTYEPLIAQAAYIMVVAILIFKFKK